jgi:co-chaperonin GroES (HSP10)
MPEAAGTQLRKGEVMGVGKGMWLLNGERAKPDVRVGDIVVYRQIAALPLTPLEGGKDSLSVISDDDILYIEAP